jgi:hypothetical protein
MSRKEHDLRPELVASQERLRHATRKGSILTKLLFNRGLLVAQSKKVGDNFVIP